MSSPTIARCAWVTDDPLYIEYHDHEWGVPVHDDTKLFEMLLLEGQQAGLSWLTILRKRENYRKALDQFNPKKIAKYGPEKVLELLQNSEIIRNRLKIVSIIQNAQAFLAIQKEFGSFDVYIWKFADFPRKTAAAEMSKALRKKGFNFVGESICYSFMQAVGMIDDHLPGCFRYTQK